MVRDITERGIDKAVALKAMRSLSIYFGGQQLYIPQRLEGSRLADEIIGVMADEVGDADAKKIYNILGALYSGVQWYVPLEKNAFRAVIAKEILAAYDGTTDSMRKLCREYGVSYTTIYRLYYSALRKKLQKELDF